MPTHSRREILVAAGAAALASSVPVCISTRAHALEVGGFRATTYSDGLMSVPTSMLFTAGENPEIDALLEESGMAGGTAKRPLNVTLVEGGGRKILFDAGSGANFLPGLGRLPSELESAGIDTGAITDVVFTHAHPDHIWGVLDDFDELMMPDAAYHISRAEWDFWDSDAALDAMPEERKAFAVGAKARFDTFRDRVSLFGFGAEILPGIEAVNSAGHTPGHTSFAVHGGGDALMVLGDALTHPLISFQHPDHPNSADMDPGRASESRRTLLDRMSTDSMRLTGYHLPAPGTGRVEKTGPSYRYIPV